MTNLLILNVGTRVKIVQYFKEVPQVKVVCTDANLAAPALFYGDCYYQIPYVEDPTHLARILEICELEQIDGVLSLIDPAIFALSHYRQAFTKRKITFIAPPPAAVDLCCDKRKMTEFCEAHNLPTVPTYQSLTDFETAYQQGQINFPVFIKPATGSASVKIQKITNLTDLKENLANETDMIIQPFMTGHEFGVDAYCDLITGELVTYFVKEKLLMRSGETDKARSVDPEPIRSILEALVQTAALKGPIDVDFFYNDGQWLISEVNPRFGGGYPFAQICGLNFPQLIVNNLNHQINPVQALNYPQNRQLMKYPEIIMVPEAEVISQQSHYGQQNVS